MSQELEKIVDASAQELFDVRWSKNSLPDYLNNNCQLNESPYRLFLKEILSTACQKYAEQLRQENERLQAALDGKSVVDQLFKEKQPEESVVYVLGVNGLASVTINGESYVPQKHLQESTTRAEKAEKACAEKDAVIQKYYAAYGFDDSVMLKRSLSSDCGKDYVHKSEVEKLKDVLHFDRNGQAQAIQRIRNFAAGFSWAKDSRGCYEWDDARFYQEMASLVDGVKEMCQNALEESGKTAHAHCCGRGERIDYSSQLHEARELVREMEYAGKNTIGEEVCLFCARRKGFNHSIDCRLSLWLEK